MAQLNDLIPLVQQKCTGVLEFMALEHLKKAYRKFCTESSYVTELKELTKVDGVIELTAPEGFYVSKVCYIDDLSGTELKEGDDYSITLENVITLSDSYDTVIVCCSIVPTITMTNDFTISTQIINKWPEQMAAGAASSLRALPNTTYSDMAKSQDYDREFTEGYREAYQAVQQAISNRHINSKSTRVFF